MAKKKAIDWQLAPAFGSKTDFGIDKILIGVSGAVLSLIVILGLIDIMDFLIDPSEYAIGQGGNVAAGSWELSYLIKSILMIIAASSLLGLILFCNKNPQKRWASAVVRIASFTVLLIVALGYITWASSGFDH
ncbi:MAG: hypothetical protein ACOH13_13885 [Flavobacteriales bacterium]